MPGGLGATGPGGNFVPGPSGPSGPAGPDNSINIYDRINALIEKGQISGKVEPFQKALALAKTLPTVGPEGATNLAYVAAIKKDIKDISGGSTGTQNPANIRANFQNAVLSAGLNLADFAALIDQATTGNWNMARFMVNLRQSPQYIQQRTFGYSNYLMSVGIPMDANLNALVEQAALHGYSQAEFETYLYQTPEFRGQFPGIFDANGTLKMSVAQYLSLKRSYTQIAQTTGLNISDQRLAFLFQHDVSPAEFQQRGAAIKQIQANPILFNQFSQALKAAGVSGQFSRGDMFKFILGEAPAEWYKVWQDAEARTSAREAGLAIGGGDLTKTVGKPGNLSEVPVISPKLIKLAEQHGLSVAQMDSGFQQVAQDFLSVVPLSRAQHMGINRKDIVEAVFGGPRQATVQKQIRGVLAAEQARQEPVAAGTSGSLQGIANTPQTQ